MARQRALAIVTGASRGLGAALVRQLAEDVSRGASEWLCSAGGGLDLVLVARDPQRLGHSCSTLEQQLNKVDGAVRVRGKAIDLGDMAQVEEACQHMLCSEQQGGWLPGELNAYTRVLLVHNAGTCGDLGYSWQQSLANIQREMQLNVVGPGAMSAALLGALARSPCCREVLVVSISSVTATQPHEGGSVYGACKAARLQMTRTLAREAELVHNPWALAQRERQQQAACGAMASDAASLWHGEGLQPDAALPPEWLGGPPVFRTLSFAPGALDTDFQAAVREGLPADAPLKQGFITNHLEGKLLDPALSAKLLLEVLRGERGAWENGQHVSVYELMQPEALAAATVPLVHTALSSPEPVSKSKHPLDFGGISKC